MCQHDISMFIGLFLFLYTDVFMVLLNNAKIVDNQRVITDCLTLIVITSPLSNKEINNVTSTRVIVTNT